MQENILICGTNWLGDSVMSMPALQLLKQQRPSSRLAMLVKPKLAELWKMHSAVDEIINLDVGVAGAFTTADAVRQRDFARAIVLPNSFRSALVPFLAGVPERVGRAGHWRRGLLTTVVESLDNPTHRHQSWEYAELLNLDKMPSDLPPPRLILSSGAVDAVAGRLALDCTGQYVGIMPGAARGSSKRWPVEYFVEVGRRLSEDRKIQLLVLGAESEKNICAEVAGGIGKAARSVAGQTSIPELAALLSLCSVVICNDSGGMHLAAACGSKVVALFGITDPATTGPLGTGHRVICAEGVARRSRDIGRYSAEAADALRSMTPDVVLKAVSEILV
jgi:heptosyltransferase II